MSFITQDENFSITIPTLATSATHTLSGTGYNPNLSAIFWGGNTTNHTGSSGREYFARCTLTNSLTITANRNTLSGLFTTTVKGRIIEFDPILVKSVQYGTIVLASAAILPADADGNDGATGRTAPISNVNLANSIVMMLGDTSTGATQACNTSLYNLELKNSIRWGGPAVWAFRQQTGLFNRTVGFCVVEFQPNVVLSKQNIESIYTNTNTTDIEAISSVDADNTIVINNGVWAGASTAYSDFLHNTQLSSNISLTYRRIGTSASQRRIYNTVLEFDPGILQSNQLTLDSFTGSSSTELISLVDLDNATILSNGHSTAATTNPSERYAAVALTGANQVTSYKDGISTTANETAATVIEFIDSTDGLHIYGGQIFGGSIL